jgi:ATP-dependent exoDNAse (exonuclease V) beta subunit
MTDINNFLREWDETICSKTIQSPDINGIRLISIHKSKGLEFPYVLVPFCDWKLEMGDTLWCQPDEAPFNQLPLVPIDYSRSGMKGTIYEKDSEEEYSQTMVDNMNVLYVAFTRASEGLYVWGRRGGSGHRSTIIEQTLPLITGDPVDGQHKSLPDATIEGLDDDQDPIHFEYGFNEANRANEAYETNETNRANKANMSSTEDDKQLNVFLQKTVSLPLRIEVHEQKVAFKQSNQSREFAAQDDEQQQTNYIQLGSVLHNVFSTIRTRDDIDSALQRMELDGILYDSHLTRERIEEMIRKRIEQPRVAEWYSKKWTLYNECTILDVDEHGDVYERRPDRVMTDGEQIIVIDFKFGRPNEDYKNQVRTYMDLLTKMGHKNIKGYLWYVYSNKIEEVFSE